MRKTPRTPEPSGETLDTFYRGRIRLIQPKTGYRFAVDAPLLSDFIRTRASDEGLELGTGNGVVSLLLSIKPFRHVVALEVQESLAALARRNVALNGLGPRIEIVTADLRDWRPGRKFDLIFSNPPYIRKASGFLSPSGEKSVAKHEILCDIETVMRKTAEWLEPQGRACFIYPSRRRPDFVAAAGAAGLRLRIIREVRPREDAAANLFLAELGFPPVRVSPGAGARLQRAAEGRRDRAGGTAAQTPFAGPAALRRERQRIPTRTPDLRENATPGDVLDSAIELPPLVLFETNGVYTDEAEAIFAGRA